MRLLGLLATAALLAVGVAAAVTVIPDSQAPEAVLGEAAPAAPPATVKHKKRKPAKPKLTPAQRRARAAAVSILRGQGYRPMTLEDYDPDHVLRVLIGKGEGGHRAFFFAGGTYLGNDVTDDSAFVKVVRTGNRSVALAYKLFKPGDRACCPRGGSTRVLFRWDGQTLAAQTAVPPWAARHAPS